MSSLKQKPAPSATPALSHVAPRSAPFVFALSVSFPFVSAATGFDDAGFGGALVGFGLVPLGAVVGAFAFFGPLINAPVFGILSTRTPVALRPKVMSAVITVAMLAGPLGLFGTGLVLAHVSIYLVFFVIAAAMTVGALAFAAVVLRRGASRNVAVADVAHGQA